MSFNPFASKAVRHAAAMGRHVRKLLHHQRDILSSNAIEEIETADRELRSAVSSKAEKAELEKRMETLEKAANKWLKPYPNPGFRENIEVLLVALAVAMAVRTFFLQPFKIPTGSMQPTLFGITSVPDFMKSISPEGGGLVQTEFKRQLELSQSLEIPTGLQRVKEWLQGASYVHVVAKADGAVQFVGRPVRLPFFGLWQKMVVGGVSYTIWFPPDYGAQALELRAGLLPGRFFRKGEDIIRMRVNAGDHLFVNRLTYNFRPPSRGEIIVFETQGIEGLERFDPSQLGTFYIKRLVGLGGERLSIKPEFEVTGVPRYGTVPVGRVAINGEPLSAADPHFEHLYSFDMAPRDAKRLPFLDNRYYGHGMIEHLAPGQEFIVSSNAYFVLGDNTMSSSDSRYWGDFDRKKVIGKCFFVYWPITPRFGVGQR